MMAISNSNLPTPSQQLFSCPQRCSTQQQGPHGPWLMHLEMALQDTKELCQCSPPPAAQIMYPTRAGLITEPAHAHTRMSALETLLAELHSN